MRLLLDTHIALWATTASPRLGRTARDAIADSANEIFVSTASLWEIAVKHALRRTGPGAMPVSVTEARRYFDASGYKMLSITPDHCIALERLPPLHGDPFDRMLVAQAVSEPLRLLTRDTRVAAYGNAVLQV